MRVAPAYEKVYSITWAYGLHRHNHWAVCFHLLGYFVPLGCYRLSGWNRRNPMVHLD
jgi:lipoprotein-anchoring transpeptidase ErfK/SrfK